MSRLDKAISDVAFILDNLILLRQILSTGDCNICNNKGNGCPFEPKAGQMVRYNCPFYKERGSGMNIENMNLKEAIEILEEVMELDDSIYAYNRKYRMALEFVIDCIKRDMAESEDFPQTKDIEPTVKGFVDTMDILDRICKESEDT